VSAVPEELAGAVGVARASGTRTAQLLAVLRGLDTAAFDRPSHLPGWSRLTIVCHLRYGATALIRMTSDALAGRETSYYPGGRAAHRPTTLAPAAGEQPEDVLAGWERTSARLDEAWSSLGQDEWAMTISEPGDNRDLGEVPLARLALARLTEVDVHGVDLDIGFPDWSEVLVDVALPTRLAWLATRRTNHREFDRSVEGRWLLVADGFEWNVSVVDGRVSSAPAQDVADPPRAMISGSRRDLLALLLGRPRRRPLDIGGDAEFGAAFERAFPGP
jgi:uncharacterized protein (TIGR03083 family)